VTSITAHGLFFCYGDLGRNGSMDEYKLYREQRVPVGPNRLPRYIEVVAAVAVVVVIYLVLR
jgi:hypothetical protein